MTEMNKNSSQPVQNDTSAGKDKVRSTELARLAISALEDKKAEDVRVIDIEEVSVLADYFIIALWRMKWKCVWEKPEQLPDRSRDIRQQTVSCLISSM